MKSCAAITFALLTLLSSAASARPNDCYDCGTSGWAAMERSCKSEILSKADFKNCLIDLKWPTLAGEKNPETHMKDGYIELGKMTTLKKPTPTSIKVIFYHQWAVDLNGTLYLLEQLG